MKDNKYKTALQIADESGVQLHKIQRIIKKNGVKPSINLCGRKGYDNSAVDKIKLFIVK